MRTTNESEQDSSHDDWRCGIEHPTEGARLWDIVAQQQRPIWAASDVLFPVIYFESPLEDAGLGGKSAGFDRAGMRSVVKTAVRIDYRGRVHDADTALQSCAGICQSLLSCFAIIQPHLATHSTAACVLVVV